MITILHLGLVYITRHVLRSTLITYKTRLMSWRTRLTVSKTNLAGQDTLCLNSGTDGGRRLTLIWRVDQPGKQEELLNRAQSTQRERKPGFCAPYESETTNKTGHRNPTNLTHPDLGAYRDARTPLTKPGQQRALIGSVLANRTELGSKSARRTASTNRRDKEQRLQGARNTR